MVKNRAGQSFPVLVRDSPICDERGELIGIIGVSTNITELKKTEDDLRTSQERFRVALRTSPVMIFTQDRELYYTWSYGSQTQIRPCDDSRKAR